MILVSHVYLHLYNYHIWWGSCHSCWKIFSGGRRVVVLFLLLYIFCIRISIIQNKNIRNNSRRRKANEQSQFQYYNRWQHIKFVSSVVDVFFLYWLNISQILFPLCFTVFIFVTPTTIVAEKVDSMIAT